MATTDEERKERQRRYSAEYRKKNKEKVAAARKRWRNNHREKIAEYDARRRELDPAKASEQYREWYEKNRESRLAQQREYSALPAVKKKRQSQALERRYGMDLDAYDALCQAQDHKCKICGVQKALHVDHCHETGVVRGLLCMDCNTGLGKLGDNLEGLRKALHYLEGVKK